MAKRTHVYACESTIVELEKIVKSEKQLCHASNILAKVNKNDLKKEQYDALEKIVPAYFDYYKRMIAITTGDKKSINNKVALLNQYYNNFEIWNLESLFSSQGKFRSTVLEEFTFLLFKPLVDSLRKKYDTESKFFSGAASAYTNMYFSAPDIKGFISHPSPNINVKNQDFAIYRRMEIDFEGEKKVIDIPVIAIENKTYLDRTMLEGIIATAEKLKQGSPYTKMVVVAEAYEVTLDMDPKYSRIDQIYVLRKCRERDISRPIDSKVVWELYQDVKDHLERPWSNVEAKLKKEGKIM